jgi:hypothetical protein
MMIHLKIPMSQRVALSCILCTGALFDVPFPSLFILVLMPAPVSLFAPPSGFPYCSTPYMARISLVWPCLSFSAGTPSDDRSGTLAMPIVWSCVETNVAVLAVSLLSARPLLRLLLHETVHPASGRNRPRPAPARNQTPQNPPEAARMDGLESKTVASHGGAGDPASDVEKDAISTLSKGSDNASSLKRYAIPQTVEHKRSSSSQALPIQTNAKDASRDTPERSWLDIVTPAETSRRASSEISYPLPDSNGILAGPVLPDR